MPLGYHPSEGEILRCDFSGFREPEMVKVRWVVVISSKDMKRGGLATIVPLSTTAPNPIERWHYMLEMILPQNEGADIEVWAKCDMVFSSSHSRLNPWWKNRDSGDKRVYVPVVLPKDELQKIRMCVLFSIGLGALAA